MQLLKLFEFVDDTSQYHSTVLLAIVLAFYSLKSTGSIPTRAWVYVLALSYKYTWKRADVALSRWCIEEMQIRLAFSLTAIYAIIYSQNGFCVVWWFNDQDSVKWLELVEISPLFTYGRNLEAPDAMVSSVCPFLVIDNEEKLFSR